MTRDVDTAAPATRADDCFAAPSGLLPLDDALDLLHARLCPAAEPVETAAVADSLGRVLAEDVVAGVAMPPHDNSAMDGFAVRHADLDPHRPVRLKVVGRAAAGHPLGRSVGPGEAARIFTGAPIPTGADTIVMQEDTTAEEGPGGPVVVVPPGAAPAGHHVRQAGEDVAVGGTVLTRGQRLGPHHVAMAASVGRDKLPVFRRLKAAVFSSGDELVAPGSPLPPGAIYEGNRFALMGLLAGLGCETTNLGILPDRREAVTEAIDHAGREFDVIVTSGGMSVGEEDHVRAAVEALGRLDFWRLKLKPGKPAALGRVGGATFIGLPGNPVSAVVVFLLIGRPVVLRLAGCTRAETVPLRIPVPAGFAFSRKPGRREFLRVRLQRTEAGETVAVGYPQQGSNIISSLIEADGLLDVPSEDSGVKPGQLYDFIPFSSMMG